MGSQIVPPGAADFAAAKCNHGELKSKTMALAANRWFQSSLRDGSDPYETFAPAFGGGSRFPEDSEALPDFQPGAP